MTPEEQLALAKIQMLIDGLGYTGTMLAAFIIAIPLLLRVYTKKPEKLPVTRNSIFYLSLSMILIIGLLIALPTIILIPHDLTPPSLNIILPLTIVFILITIAIGFMSINFFMATNPPAKSKNNQDEEPPEEQQTPQNNNQDEEEPTTRQTRTDLD